MDYNQPYYNSQNPEPVSIGEWLLIHLLFCIPCVGLIMMFVWGFGDSAKKSVQTYCRSMLVVMAIMVGICILMLIFTLIFGVSLLSAIL